MFFLGPTAIFPRKNTLNISDNSQAIVCLSLRRMLCRKLPVGLRLCFFWALLLFFYTEPCGNLSRPKRIDNPKSEYRTPGSMWPLSHRLLLKSDLRISTHNRRNDLVFVESSPLLASSMSGGRNITQLITCLRTPMTKQLVVMRRSSQQQNSLHQPWSTINFSLRLSALCSLTHTDATDTTDTTDTTNTLTHY